MPYPEDISAITPADLPLIETTAQLREATIALSERCAAFLVARTLESDDRPITNIGEALDLTATYLNEITPGWITDQGRERMILPDDDLGMHGNRSLTERYKDNDYLHFHHTARGALQLTTAMAGPDYVAGNRVHNAILSVSHRHNLVYPELADPATFQRGTVHQGMGVLFRLRGSGADECLLHDFETITPYRFSTIHAIARTVSGTPQEFYAQ
ncbi:MAG TPA: hypothetical protein VLA92_01090 [Candidatus Saccharimonadales bacterium]|nr:hypothetical protein [Candidatus Saccharimonadales bacterium]